MAALLAGGYTASLTPDPARSLLYISPFVVGTGAFLAAAALIARSPRRSAFLGLCGALVVAGWAVTTGYGPGGLVNRPAAIVGAIAALACLATLPLRARVVAAVGVLGAAGVLVTVAVAPFALPAALLWIYGAMASGGSFAILAAMPGAAEHSPAPVVGFIAVLGRLVGAGALLLAFGLPLANS